MSKADWERIQRWAGVPVDGNPGPVTARAIIAKAAIADDRPTRTLQDPAAFFAAVRKVTGPLNQVQVDSISRLLSSAAHHPIGWVAYELATGWHEARFKPQPEWGLGKGRPYEKPGKYGQPQYGRGLVQLTWDANYEWADKAAAEAGLIKKGELLANFDLALRPDLAAFILVKGMEEGAFTGVSLADRISERGSPAEWVRGRPIVNSNDKAELIAGYAETFCDGLDAGVWK